MSASPALSADLRVGGVAELVLFELQYLVDLMWPDEWGREKMAGGKEVEKWIVIGDIGKPSWYPAAFPILPW
jgi:hypothetical protein